MSDCGVALTIVQPQYRPRSNLVAELARVRGSRQARLKSRDFSYREANLKLGAHPKFNQTWQHGKVAALRFPRYIASSVSNRNKSGASALLPILRG
jgi:hypothetical protein